MVKSYCVRDDEYTTCVEPSGYQETENGRWLFYCHCSKCGLKKTTFVKNNGDMPKQPTEDKIKK